MKWSLWKEVCGFLKERNGFLVDEAETPVRSFFIRVWDLGLGFWTKHRPTTGGILSNPNLKNQFYKGSRFGFDFGAMGNNGHACSHDDKYDSDHYFQV